MKILITGGTGFVGKELGKRLAEHNHDIYILTRQSPEAAKNVPFPCTFINEESLTELESLDAVFHLAGEPVAQKWTTEVKAKIESSRVQGTERLIKKLEKLNPKVFIGASAIGYYGDRGDELLTETSEKGKGFLADVCEKWEASTFKARDILGARVAILRIGIVLGWGGGALEQMIEPFKMGLGGPVGSGKQWMSWIHINDLVGMFVWALENQMASGIYNAVAPEPVTNKDFSEVLARSLGTTSKISAPEIALKAKFGEMAQIIFSSQKISSDKIKNSNFLFEFPKLESALKQILNGLRAGEEMYIFEQWIHKKPEEIFSFYEDANNLQKITPPWLDFKVLGTSTPALGKDTLIDYQLKLYGIPFKWKTKIEIWQKNVRFVDTQLKGPYQKWHHTHEFIPLGEGTLVRDVVKFIIPMGFVGYIASGWKVKSDVKKIFAYRRDITHKLLGNEHTKI